MVIEEINTKSNEMAEVNFHATDGNKTKLFSTRFLDALAAAAGALREAFGRDCFADALFFLGRLPSETSVSPLLSV